MNPERWKQIKNIYQHAIESAPEKRTMLLDNLCGDDRELRDEVESMLGFENESRDFIEDNAFNVISRIMAKDEMLSVGERVDNYKIVREIGRGGMGAVYLAERVDGLFEHRVALKAIKRGMDTDAILKRFVMERQILAGLDHPNIARLLDGGTTDDGLPYFVMEYVEGLPVDKFCEEKNLNLTERLKLFRQICDAVSYAHQNLVVHRDLKPSNILVTKDCKPKLLDFGIAKLLHTESDGETKATETVARMLTPEYASPEQFAGDKITTQSDVYSLGVLLHKLVFGNAEKSVTGTKTKTSSGRTFDKDLRAILETSRHIEPARRYKSVEAFSEDIRRLLEGLPVLAQRDSFFYRTTKYVQRNAAAVSLSSLAILALIFAAGFSIRQARKANAAQSRAERRFNDVRKLANNVLFVYHDAIENLPNSTEVREKMLKDSLEYLDSLSSEAANDKELLRELGTAYEKIGTIQGNSYFANLNDTPAMLSSYKKCFEIREKLVALDPDNDELKRELAIAIENLGDVYHQTGDLKAALSHYERARRIIGELAAKDAKHLTYFARLHNQIAHVQGFPGESNLGETTNAIENYRKAVEIMQRLYDSDNTSTKYIWGLSVYRRNLGNMLLHTGDTKGALEQVTQSLKLTEAWLKIEPDNTNAQESLGLCFGKLADIYSEMNDVNKAIEFLQKEIALDEPAYLKDPKNRRAREVSISYYKLADLYVKKRDFAAAEKWHLKALKIFEQNYDEDKTSVDNQITLADSWYSIGVMYEESGRLSEAKEFYDKCLKSYEDVAARDKSNLRVRVNAATAIIGLGDISFKKGNFTEALKNYEQALPVLEEQAKRDSVNVFLQRELEELKNKISDSKNNDFAKEVY